MFFSFYRRCLLLSHNCKRNQARITEISLKNSDDVSPNSKAPGVRFRGAYFIARRMLLNEPDVFDPRRL